VNSVLPLPVILRCNQLPGPCGPSASVPGRRDCIDRKLLPLLQEAQIRPRKDKIRFATTLAQAKLRKNRYGSFLRIFPVDQHPHGETALPIGATTPAHHRFTFRATASCPSHPAQAAGLACPRTHRPFRPVGQRISHHALQLATNRRIENVIESAGSHDLQVAVPVGQM